MRFPYSADSKPLLSISLALTTKKVSALALLDSGSDVNVLPLAIGEALGAKWDQQKTTLRLGGTLTGRAAMPLLVSGELRGFAPVRLAFAWCQTNEVPLILGQTNFFMEFDICFFRSRGEFSVQPKGIGTGTD